MQFESNSNAKEKMASQKEIAKSWRSQVDRYPGLATHPGPASFFETKTKRNENEKKRRRNEAFDFDSKCEAPYALAVTIEFEC